MTKTNEERIKKLERKVSKIHNKEQIFDKNNSQNVQNVDSEKYDQQIEKIQNNINNFEMKTSDIQNLLDESKSNYDNFLSNYENQLLHVNTEIKLQSEYISSCNSKILTSFNILEAEVNNSLKIKLDSLENNLNETLITFKEKFSTFENNNMTLERSVSDNHSQFIKQGIKFRLLQEEVKTLSELNYKEIIDDSNKRINFNEKNNERKF